MTEICKVALVPGVGDSTANRKTSSYQIGKVVSTGGRRGGEENSLSMQGQFSLWALRHRASPLGQRLASDSWSERPL